MAQENLIGQEVKVSEERCPTRPRLKFQKQLVKCQRRREGWSYGARVRWRDREIGGKIQVSSRAYGSRCWAVNRQRTKPCQVSNEQATASNGGKPEDGGASGSPEGLDVLLQQIQAEEHGRVNASVSESQSRCHVFCSEKLYHSYWENNVHLYEKIARARAT
ncbi:hypothetical protein CBL_04305 [Carabus blaptoides fortunei]